MCWRVQAEAAAAVKAAAEAAVAADGAEASTYEELTRLERTPSLARPTAPRQQLFKVRRVAVSTVSGGGPRSQHFGGHRRIERMSTTLHHDRVPCPPSHCFCQFLQVDRYSIAHTPPWVPHRL